MAEQVYKINNIIRLPW